MEQNIFFKESKGTSRKEKESEMKTSVDEFSISMHIVEVQFSSVAQSCPTFWDPKNHSTPGLPVHHQLPEFTQTHVH